MKIYICQVSQFRGEKRRDWAGEGVDVEVKFYDDVVLGSMGEGCLLNRKRRKKRYSSTQSRSVRAGMGNQANMTRRSSPDCTKTDRLKQKYFYPIK